MAHKQWTSPCLDGQPLDREWTEYVREMRDGYEALLNNHSPEEVSNFIKKYAAPGSDYERLQGVKTRTQTQCCPRGSTVSRTSRRGPWMAPRPRRHEEKW